MAQDNKNFTDELRQRLSIVDVVSRRVPLIKKGQNFWGCCPFHNEKTPSFSVNNEKGFYHCFGCGEHGDIISFVMKTENLEFVAAITELADMAGVKMPDYKPRDINQIAREKSYTEITEAATSIYQEKLFSDAGTDALAYVRSRGFSDDMIKKYRLGYAPKNNLISAKFGGTKSENLIATGLVRMGDYGPYDFFRDKLMFPIFNASGVIIAFSGRSLDGSQPKYINTVDTELFHKRATLFGLNFARDAIHRANQSIVVEGQIDAIKMQISGFGETVAPLGTALTDQHLNLLSKSNRNIVFCFDGDAAGAKAAARACSLSMEILRDNSNIKFAFMPAGKDPDEILKSGKDGIQTMKKIIADAAPITDFLWELANKNYITNTPGGRAQAEKFLKMELEKITDRNLRNEFEKEYNIKKFNNWHKWNKAKKSDADTAVPDVDKMTMNNLRSLVATYPEILEKYAEFLATLNISFDEDFKPDNNMTYLDAEKFIVSLKLKNYLDILGKQKKELFNKLINGDDTVRREIENIDTEIKKSKDRLELLIAV